MIWKHTDSSVSEPSIFTLIIPPFGDLSTCQELLLREIKNIQKFKAASVRPKKGNSDVKYLFCERFGASTDEDRTFGPKGLRAGRDRNP